MTPNNVPPVNFQVVAQQLSTKISDLIFQNAQLENIANTAIAERDAAIAERDNLQRQEEDSDTTL